MINIWLLGLNNTLNLKNNNWKGLEGQQFKGRPAFWTVRLTKSEGVL